MSRFSARLLHVASLLVIGSGAIWAYLRYVHDLGPEPEDPVLATEPKLFSPRLRSPSKVISLLKCLSQSDIMQVHELPTAQISALSR